MKTLLGMIALLFAPLVFSHEGGELTAAQVAVGFISFMGFIKVLSVGLLVAGIAFICKGLIKTVLDMKKTIEFSVWALAVICMIGSYFLPTDYLYLQDWSVPVGILLFPLALGVSSHYRKWEPNYKNLSFTLALVWGIAAVIYMSSFVGFFAVGAILSALGFSMVVTPFCHSFGFTDEDDIPKGIFAGLIMVTLYSLYKVFGLDNEYLEVFEDGALWLGGFVMGVGLLIVSSRWYTEKGHYIVMNLLSVTLLIVGSSVGLLFSIQEVTTLFLVFLLFYLSEKVIEVETESMVAIGLKLIVTGGFLVGVYYYLHTHQDLAVKYLTISF